MPKKFPSRTIDVRTCQRFFIHAFLLPIFFLPCHQRLIRNRPVFSWKLPSRNLIIPGEFSVIGAFGYPMDRGAPTQKSWESEGARLVHFF